MESTRKHADSLGYLPYRSAAPLGYSRTSCCTIALVSYNLLLTIAMCVFFISVSSELNRLRTSCGVEKENKTSNTGCQNYKTVDNIDDTENGLSSSIEMILRQYTSYDSAGDQSDPSVTEDGRLAGTDEMCNDTDDVMKILEHGGMDSLLSRETRAKDGNRRVPSGFAHFHGGRGINTNYNVREVIDIWEAADWVDVTKFKMDNPGGAASKITVQARGLYYLYSQVTFKDINRYHGYTVYVGDEPHLQCYFENPLTQCTGPVKKNGVCASRREERCAVCYTGGLVYINKRDKISIQMIFPDRIVSGHKADTFFGLLKVR